MPTKGRLGCTVQANQMEYEDVLFVLLRQENSYTLPTTYFDLQKGSSKLGISKIHREKMCVWAFQILDHFHFDRETASVFASNLDRCLSYRASCHQYLKKIEKREFQLIAMVALYIAVKVHEPHHMTHQRFSLYSVSNLSQGHFTAEELFWMEKQMLSDLKWKLHPPTCLSFLREFVNCFDERITNRCSTEIVNFVIDLSCFLSELAVCDADTFCIHKSSVIALASLFNATEKIDLDYLGVRCRLRFLTNIEYLMPSISIESKELFTVQEKLNSLFLKTKSASRYDQYLKGNSISMEDIYRLRRSNVHHLYEDPTHISFSEESEVYIYDADMMDERSTSSDDVVGRERSTTEETPTCISSHVVLDPGSTKANKKCLDSQPTKVDCPANYNIVKGDFPLSSLSLSQSESSESINSLKII